MISDVICLRSPTLYPDKDTFSRLDRSYIILRNFTSFKPYMEVSIAMGVPPVVGWFLKKSHLEMDDARARTPMTSGKPPCGCEMLAIAFHSMRQGFTWTNVWTCELSLPTAKTLQGGAPTLQNRWCINHGDCRYWYIIYMPWYRLLHIMIWGVFMGVPLNHPFLDGIFPN